MSGAMISRWNTAASPTMTHSQVRERNSDPALAQVSHEAAAARFGGAVRERAGAADAGRQAGLGGRHAARATRTGARPRRPHRKAALAR